MIQAMATQLTSIDESPSVASEDMKSNDEDQDSLPSTLTTKIRRRKILPRKKGNQLVQLSSDGKKIMTTLLAVPIHNHITTKLLKNTTMKEGVGILLSIAA